MSETVSWPYARRRKHNVEGIFNPFKHRYVLCDGVFIPYKESLIGCRVKIIDRHKHFIHSFHIGTECTIDGVDEDFPKWGTLYVAKDATYHQTIHPDHFEII